jgi:hypothetical protein
VFVGIEQPHKKTPPVVDERDGAGHDLATLEILRGKSAPAPLVFEFVEGVLAVGSGRDKAERWLRCCV